MKYIIATHIDHDRQEFIAEVNDHWHAVHIAKKVLKNRIAKATTEPKEYGYDLGEPIQKGE